MENGCVLGTNIENNVSLVLQTNLFPLVCIKLILVLVFKHVNTSSTNPITL